MKKLIYILLLLLPNFVSAQETKKLDSPMIYVSFDKIKHVILPAPVSDISYGREDFIKVERVESVPNITHNGTRGAFFRNNESCNSVY